MKNQLLRDYFYMIIGSILVGISYNFFLLPSEIAAGGISGVSTILYSIFRIQPYLIQFLINVPIFIAGWFILGRSFSIKTAVATFLIPFIIFISKDYVVYGVHNSFLGALYGGIVLGIGLGLVYRGKGSTGGTATLAQIVKKYTSLSSGFCQLIVDATVVLLSAFVLSFESALYALISIYVTSKVIDFVELKSGDNKLVFIITDKEEEVSRLIYDSVGRGLTKIHSMGGYTGEQKTLLFSVMEQREAVYFKQVINQKNPDAFVIFLSASDIIGRGFSKEKSFILKDVTHHD
ncbi:YitT family protein [Macrococcus carouselicus]|uniref:YitT family protein n=1 Tax=Macrococcus carouselicus TaxID=69969 RepID=A0A9Q8CMJ7_9STAP|nr:YitT family protein [Macrococcus carouselicus]TDM03672.1 YitT family protein [Macrococcus carouselicus]